MSKANGQAAKISCSGHAFASVEAMCHNVHMKTISIRELHLRTGQWVRHAASRGPIVVTDRGRRVAALQPFDASVTGRPLPNRETAIRKRSKVPVDSAVYQSELREDR
jgi:prevent-host-death family protein